MTDYTTFAYGPEQFLMIWDGDCQFCARAVEWLRTHDANGRIAPVPYQVCPSPPMTPELFDASRHAVQIVSPNGDVVSGGEAALLALHVVGWHPWLVRIGRAALIRPVIRASYRTVANHRDLFGRVFFRRT